MRSSPNRRRINSEVQANSPLPTPRSPDAHSARPLRLPSYSLRRLFRILPLNPLRNPFSFAKTKLISHSLGPVFGAVSNSVSHSLSCYSSALICSGASEICAEIRASDSTKRKYGFADKSVSRESCDQDGLRTTRTDERMSSECAN